MFSFRCHSIHNYHRKLFIIILFKHIRFKSSVNIEPILSKDLSKRRIKYISEILDCDVSTAHTIVLKNKNILSIDHFSFTKNVNFCHNHFRLSEIIDLPFILTLNLSLLQHRYFSLKELGLLNINASHIIRFQQILKKSPKMLKEEGISFSNDHSLSILNKFLNLSENAEVQIKLQKMYAEGISLLKIKEIINAEFFVVKLGYSIGKAQKMLHNYPPLRVQSILNTEQTLNILLQKFDFSMSQITSSLNLLSLHHEEVENFLAEVPDVLGIKTEKLIKKMPALLRRSVESIHKVQNILHDFNISDTQFMCCPKIIMFDPNTLKNRLIFLCNSEYFAMLKSYKKFLWLAYYFNNLNSRLETLKEMDIPCSISMFIVSKSTFEKYLCVSQCRTHINDICFYLTKIFNISEKDILIRLREYPNYPSSSLINCRKVVEFLLQSGVTKKQIFNGIGIIFYDIDDVKSYFRDLKYHPSCQPYEEWILHYNLIQLLIYVIEVDSGFQGSRLYQTKTNFDDQELVARYS